MQIQCLYCLLFHNRFLQVISYGTSKDLLKSRMADIHLSLTPRDLDTPEVLASIWDIRFNPSKCYILSVCKTEDKKIYHLYTLCSVVLEYNKITRTLVIPFSQNLSFHNQIQNISAKAKSTLGLPNRNLKSRPNKLKVKLEYASPVWDPYLLKEILERV